MIINKLFSWWMQKRMHQIELFMKYPLEVQNEWFDHLIQNAKRTEWGKKHGYDSIDSLADFRNQVPIQEYEAIKPYVDRMMQGEEDILWPGETKWYAKSSGTTSGKSKFIPVTKDALEECHYKGGKDMLSIYCNSHKENEVFAGKSLMMGGSSQVIDPDSNSYHGDLSSIIIRNLPFWAEIKRTPNREIALMKDFEAKLELMAEICSKENVSSISGVPSWNLILLNKILEKTGADNISEVWPNLEVFFHGGVAFTPYRPQFEAIIRSDKMNYLETYNASEGFFGIEDPTYPSELLLMLDYGIYYEFIPPKEWNASQPNTLSLEEVKIGVDYALLISTNAGLWRYKIGDTIRFTNLKPFRFKVSGRTKHFMNAFGEEVIIDNAEKALEKACAITGAIIEEYTAAPVYLTNSDAGRHEWLIEFKRNPDSLPRFTDLLDETLQSLNSDYEAKRAGNIALIAPLVKPLENGTFYRWMKSRNKLGGQNKIPRLSNTREYIEAILRLEAVDLNS